MPLAEGGFLIEQAPEIEKVAAFGAGQDGANFFGENFGGGARAITQGLGIGGGGGAAPRLIIFSFHRACFFVSF